jgi:beta-glucosidase
VNFYNETPVAWDKKAPCKYTGKPFWQDTSEMGWPLTPGGLERQLNWIAGVSKTAFGASGGEGLPIYITENGYARNDEVGPDGGVHDRERIEYIRQHLAVCAELIKEGVPLKGYYAWSFLDNFEWAWGYTRRFGIVHVDYFTQKRSPKDSAWFFRDVIAGYGEW